jgi:hypothetical protein
MQRIPRARFPLSIFFYRGAIVFSYRTQAIDRRPGAPQKGGAWGGGFGARGRAPHKGGVGRGDSRARVGSVRGRAGPGVPRGCPGGSGRGRGGGGEGQPLYIHTVPTGYLYRSGDPEGFPGTDSGLSIENWIEAAPFGICSWPCIENWIEAGPFGGRLPPRL